MNPNVVFVVKRCVRFEGEEIIAPLYRSQTAAEERRDRLAETEDQDDVSYEVRWFEVV